jgi:prolyl 4-hydroxylase
VVAVDELGEYADVEDTIGWTFFTPYGTPLPTPATVMLAFRECGTVYVVEGGEFVWPGIRVGHNVTLDTGDPYFGEVTMTTLSLVPRIFTIEPLLTQSECEWIVDSAAKEMEHKLLGSVAKVDTHLAEKGDSVVATEKRTSTQARLPKGEHPIVAQIERRAHRILRVPESHGEPLQVVRYRKGERYGNHHDYFDPDLYQKQPGIMKMIADGDRQRLATLLWYIAEPEGGGETHFPRAGGLPNPDYRLTTCPFQDGSVDRTGVIVPPRRGECYSSAAYAVQSTRSSSATNTQTNDRLNIHDKPHLWCI